MFFKIAIGIVAAYFLAVFAFAYEPTYREFVRFLYELLTQNDITFKNYGKYLHFASGEFISGFVIFTITIFLLLKRQDRVQRVRNTILGILFLITSTLTFCYYDSQLKILECTACDDGKRDLAFDDVNYDLIFISSLILAILPSVVSDLKNKARTKSFD